MIELTKRHKGDIVRITPYDLVFVTQQSYRDIYSQPTKGKKLFNKSPYFYTGFGEPGLSLIMDPEKHAAERKRLAPGFSTRALRDQEYLIHEYTDQFTQLIRRMMKENEQGIDMVATMSWLTFDIAGTFSFSVSQEQILTLFSI